MAVDCPKCAADNPAAARYCCRCGRPMPSTQSREQAESLPAEPLSCPVGFEACDAAEHLYYRWEAVGTESMFGCEYLGVTLFNGGSSLADVRLMLNGRGDEDQTLFELERGIHRIERGQSVSLEIARNELPSVPQRVEVALVSSSTPKDDKSTEGKKSWNQQRWWDSSW